MRTEQLCRSTYCGLPRQHVDDCDDPTTCRGCLPARAADGLYLCDLCTRRIVKDAWSAAWRHAALGLVLVAAGRGDGIGGVSKDPGLDLNPAVVEARDAIRSTMLALVKVITSERNVSPPSAWKLVHLPAGMTGPPNRVRTADLSPAAVAKFIGPHAEWLAGHRDAAQWAGWLRDVVTDSRTMRLAFPAGSDRLYIGDCPRPTGDTAAPCGARLHQLPDVPLITCRGCGHADTVEWWQQAITGETGGIVDAYAAAGYLSNTWMRPVDPAAVREWGRRPRAATFGVAPLTEPDPTDPTGEATRVWRDAKARVVYDLAALKAYATQLWGEPPRLRRRV